MILNPLAQTSLKPLRSAGPWVRLSLALLLFANMGATMGLRAESFQSVRIADGFDFPVGPPNAAGYYKARGFWPNGHLGEDWNGRGGGNTDLGDPVYSMGHGIVVYSADFGSGWGNVIIIRHAYRERNGRIYYVDSLYGHLQDRNAKLYEQVKRGQKIGTIGRGPRNMYYAHLHFEIRKNLALGMNRSKFKRDYSNYHSPTHFISGNRRLRAEFRKVRVPVDTFLKSNPNTYTTTLTKPLPAESANIRRPNAPTQVREVMERQGDTSEQREAGAPPVGSEAKSFWQKFKDKFRILGGNK